MVLKAYSASPSYRHKQIIWYPILTLNSYVCIRRFKKIYIVLHAMIPVYRLFLSSNFCLIIMKHPVHPNVFQLERNIDQIEFTQIKGTLKI